jgi:hypothetical protein
MNPSEPDATRRTEATMTARLHSIAGETRARSGVALSRARAVRDFTADWKRWSLAERVGAVALVASLIFSSSITYALRS